MMVPPRGGGLGSELGELSGTSRCPLIYTGVEEGFQITRFVGSGSSTSFVERQNLSMRMSIRGFTRLTNAFSKKVENHAAAVALWSTYYNSARVHQTLRVTPAMETGISTHVWTIEELVSLLAA